jgi:hypothetical protein
MDKRKIGLIGAVAGAALGVAGAVLGIALWASSAGRDYQALGPAATVTLAWVGGLLGGAVGVLGGILGTYASVKNTNGPRERAFVVRVAALCWLLVLAFLAGLLLLPGWYKHLLWIPYVILLVIGIRYWNQMQMRIRREESEGA